MRSSPYPKNRVYLSAAIAGLSILLAVALFSNDPILIAYYFLSTAGITIITFLLKRYLYALISVREDLERETEPEEGTPWGTLLLVLVMSVAIFVAPLFLTQVLSATVWFILIVSFTSGVSISEVILYLQTRR
jgi:hypothetical protein